MKIHLAYGKHGLDVEVPDKNLAKVLILGLTPPLANPAASVRRSLLTPIGSPPLAQLAQNVKTVSIAVCDITRPVPNKLLLPAALVIVIIVLAILYIKERRRSRKAK